MDISIFLIQLLNALQYGLLLFLVASGLTLIFGIMGIINLAHGSFYMLGAYFAATFAVMTDSFVLAALLAMIKSLLAAKDDDPIIQKTFNDMMAAGKIAIGDTGAVQYSL